MQTMMSAFRVSKEEHDRMKNDVDDDEEDE
jgi:hypothetical protein